MIRGSEDLRQYAIHAADADLGRVHDFYFEDQRWTLRYLVVNTGHWISRQRVLLPLQSVVEVDDAHRVLRVALTKAQVAASPDVDTDKPVSRQYEIMLARHYGFPYGWNRPLLRYPRLPKGAGDPHLRSLRTVAGYFVREVNDHVGTVQEFLIDDAPWRICYLVVTTSNWWPGEKVLLAPDWVRAVRWDRAEVAIDLTRDQLQHAPEYDPERPIDREYEQRLYASHERRPYWGGPAAEGRGKTKAKPQRRSPRPLARHRRGQR